MCLSSFCDMLKISHPSLGFVKCSSLFLKTLERWGPQPQDWIYHRPGKEKSCDIFLCPQPVWWNICICTTLYVFKYIWGLLLKKGEDFCLGDPSLAHSTPTVWKALHLRPMKHRYWQLQTGQQRLYYTAQDKK